MSEASGAPRTAHAGTDDPDVAPAAAPGGEVAQGTGEGGSRFGQGSLESAAGTGSLDERGNDGETTGEKFIVTDAGEHIPLSEL